MVKYTILVGYRNHMYDADEAQDYINLNGKALDQLADMNPAQGPSGVEEYRNTAEYDVSDVFDEHGILKTKTASDLRGASFYDNILDSMGDTINEFAREEHGAEMVTLLLEYREPDMDMNTAAHEMSGPRQNIYDWTEVLEQEYGLVKVEFGKVRHTRQGEFLCDAIERLRDTVPQ